ncbi:hypothetical protein, partial [Pseudomonas syringae]|uniref:hypothetical protein n=1 Tax=Pseudomonas syringae TaxID=317 RepID=UPI0024E06B6E
GLLIFEIGQDCYANPQLLMTNRQSALGHFSIGRMGQFSISADTLLFPIPQGYYGRSLHIFER